MVGVRSGATQWRHDCDCHPDLAEARDSQHWERIHSEVSKANAEFFIKESRVDDDVFEADLRDLVDEHEHVLVCNLCSSIKTLDNSSDSSDSSTDAAQAGQTTIGGESA